eukprot:CAMPEP_0202900576 /NCGR_PEP_ID=MMETSP1392-20130828/11916_1 /ASSEMBLY_ACC=CAM_ASM_000868 /TAXON_ID=225041 /ORGANISM="Chlamydomonas chlamydogama, Strain SAG 11-48b" /LENGTH=865 /DNA_ID=CAMNT_0049586993 /DNA_START=281 /DNA_END=2875 /DNA_ORIENTATION=+
MAAPVDVTQFLLNAQNPEASVRTAAEEHLKLFQEQNFPQFVYSLAAEIANNAKPVDARRLAGLVLKNTLDAKEEARKRDMHGRWIALDPTLKQHVRDALASTLHSETPDVRHTAAMVLAKVAAIDLPRKEWPTLIQTLLNNMGAQPPVVGTRQATLEAMGYVCEEMGNIKEEVLTPQEINMILTAVVSAMGPSEPNESRLSATIALCNAIEFAQHNFENDNERNVLMQVVCEGTQSPEIRIRTAAFECLHEIAALYYNKLPAYITQLYNITVKAIKEDQEEVSLQAIEFWSTICDTELDLTEDPDPDEPCHNFIKAAAPHLIPILLELLTKQEEGQEQDDTGWNISMAAGTCLGLAARVVQDSIVPMVMPFIQANISKNAAAEDWRLREAATFAFGLILDGPSPSAFTEYVRQALGFFLQAMKDPHPYVKDTTAWTIGRIFEFVHSVDIEPPIITRDTLPPVIAVLLESLKDEPHIAYRVCCTISALAAGFKGSSGGTSLMSPFFKDCIAALLQCAQRHANYDHAKVQISAFEAINDLVRAASRDTLDIVAQLIQVVLPEIHKTFEMPAASAEARERQAEVQGQLCGVLQVIIQKLSEEEDTKAAVLPYADQIMETLLRIFSARSANVHEEAMLAVGSFTYALGKNFNKYLPQFAPYLSMGLTNYQEWQVCLSTVGVLGDVCRNVEEGILPYCDDIMSLLIQNLGREDVHRTIKPQILSAFGDIALVVADKFEKYLEAVLRVLKQAMHLSVVSAASADPDTVDYNNELRHGIIDAYSGIMQGMGPAKCEQYLRNEVPGVVEFLSSVGTEAEFDEDVCKAAVNLLGDMCSVISGAGGLIRACPKNDWEKLVAFCKEQSSNQDETEW